MPFSTDHPCRQAHSTVWACTGWIRILRDSITGQMLGWHHISRKALN